MRVGAGANFFFFQVLFKLISFKMSLQWTIIAVFLYAEIFVVLLLVLPVASARRWNMIFKSKFLQVMQKQAGYYFMILLAILCLFLLDAIREMTKYSNQGKLLHSFQ